MTIVAQVKSSLRPLGRLRRVVEMSRYWGVSVLDPSPANELLSRSLNSGGPCAIGKLGASELTALRYYLQHRDDCGHCSRWASVDSLLHRNAGVFPADPTIYSRFCDCYLEAVSQVDVLAVWFRWGERAITRQYASGAQYIRLGGLEPYYHERPWSRDLAGKRVLVVTPFADTVETQYARRREVWASRPDILPDFALETLQVPLSAALVPSPFRDWFKALEHFRAELTRRNFDVAIIGAGAWSLPLAVHVKRLGKWALHLGGPVQVLFGIRGRRWDGNSRLLPFYNSTWVRPADRERPSGYRQIEDGCYW